MQDDEDGGGTPPCFAHEMVGGFAVDAKTKADVDRFRKAERARLYDLRRTMSQPDRVRQTLAVTKLLETLVDPAPGTVIAAYWPIRGELDLRPWMSGLHDKGATVALPVVIERGRPVAFHRWSPGCPMVRGFWNIPGPERAEPLQPDIVIVPLVGVDRACFRLGNGGGYYDMTLAGLPRKPRTIAVGQDFCTLSTIFPQPWDVRMDCAVLGDGTILHPPVA